MIDWAAFEAWLREPEGRYADSTIRMTLTDARQLCTHAENLRSDSSADSEPPTRLYAAAMRVRAWLRTSEAKYTDELWAVLEQATSAEARHAAFSRKRKNPARAFDLKAWDKLARAIVGDETIEARVIELCLVTGLRIGDALSVRRGELARGAVDGAMVLIQKGDRERELYVRGRILVAVKRLLTIWGSGTRTTTLAARVYSGDSARGAYDRVRNRLTYLARDLGIEGRVHLHRMRRTLAMQALAITKDVGAVQQMLGHRSITTTMQYLDEERPEAVAELQDKLHAFLPSTEEE